MNIIKSLDSAYQLTQSSLDAASAGDWPQAEKTILKRDLQLQNFPTDFSNYDSTQQMLIREKLEALTQLNADFSVMAQNERSKALNLKSEIVKNKIALEKYLDIAAE